MSSTVIEAWPLAARMSSAVGSSSNIWHVLVGEPDRVGPTKDALLLELESLYDGPIRNEVVHSVEDWLAAVEADRDDVLVLALESRWDSGAWRRIDMQRSRLMREGMTVLVAGREDVALMVHAAPNLWSWIGGKVWELRVEEEQLG